MNSEYFKLEGDDIALCALLKLLNLSSSGGEAKHVISEGLVKVDGQVETRKRYKVKLGQKVQYNSHIIEIVN